MSAKAIRAELAKVRVHNLYDFYHDQPHVALVRGDGWERPRIAYVATVKGAEKVFTFHPAMKERVLAEAQQWVNETADARRVFGPTAASSVIQTWVKDPFGGWGKAEFIKSRIEFLLLAANSPTT